MFEVHSVVLPSGRVFNLQRLRSEGVLDDEELSYCRHHDVALGYDCAQGGWVPLSCDDDLGSAASSPMPLVPVFPGLLLEETVRKEKSRLLRDATDIAEQVRRGQLSASHGEQKLSARVDAAVEDLVVAHDLVSADRARTALGSALAPVLMRLRGAQPRPAEDTLRSDLRFRAWRFDDAPVYGELLGSPNVWRYMSDEVSGPLTEEMARQLIQISWLESRHDVAAVELDGRPVGQCRLRFDEPYAGTRAAELVYWLGEQHWGRGVMGRALPAFIRHGFERHGLDSIYAWILEENVVSLALAERIGFRRETWRLGPQLARELKKGKGALRLVCHRCELLG